MRKGTGGLLRQHAAIPILAAKQAILESILPGRSNISATVATVVICDLPLLISLTISNGPPMRTSGDTNALFPRLIHHPLASQVQRALPRAAGWLLIRTSRAPSAIYSAAGGSSSPLNRLLMLPITAFTLKGGFQHTVRTQQVKGRSRGVIQKGGFFVRETASVRKDVYGSRFYRQGSGGAGAALATVGCHSSDTKCVTPSTISERPSSVLSWSCSARDISTGPVTGLTTVAMAPPFPDIPRPHPGTFWHPPDAALLPVPPSPALPAPQCPAAMPQSPLPARQVCC